MAEWMFPVAFCVGFLGTGVFGMLLMSSYLEDERAKKYTLLDAPLLVVSVLLLCLGSGIFGWFGVYE
ncbi:hypothetical protein SEA_CHEWYVIII_20 [Rhodococcus phage ChewyVIII]|uniref:Uncharacterized protein n=1 Tax=Rhodococcus phage ChewyVIII TaxID=1887657 RepID=A0A1C9EIA6_9CAUD|nr:hypothetical protein QEH30_gp20 [Rhodococcus phage ChewyVIII]AON97516.1 hypothetical protein SEA_CHEWYVIII_20 [Rhodococcus phage ChewyVIII]